MTTREIRTSDTNVECAVCGRSLLRGENCESYLHDGHRRTVCELCTGRADRAGWIRESEGSQVGARSRGHDRGRSLVARLRKRRRQPTAENEQLLSDTSANGLAIQRELGIAEQRDTRHVHAVPTSDELKISRALELFNGSEHPRTIAGVARSLGGPSVCVRPISGTSIVRVTAAWELCWYRYELDLADEAGGVRVNDQGYELSELDAEERETNAAADDHGTLALVVV